MKGKRLKKVYFKPLDESNEKLVREVTLKSDQRNLLKQWMNVWQKQKNMN